MSVPGAWSRVCVQHDPVNSTCTAGSILPKRSLSLPVKRHRPFRSPQRSGSCVCVNSQARPIALAATVTADTVRTDQASVSSPLPSPDDRLRQLEASYKAQSAAEVLHVEMQPRSLDASSDTEGTQFEVSWQAQAEASTSGRASAPQSSASFVARLYSKKSNPRAHRRSSRVYAASTRRNQSQNHGVARPPQIPTGCPDTQFCKVIRDRLKKEKQTRRISRSEPSTPSALLHILLHKLQVHLCTACKFAVLIHLECYWHALSALHKHVLQSFCTLSFVRLYACDPLHKPPCCTQCCASSATATAQLLSGIHKAMRTIILCIRVLHDATPMP